MFERVGIFVTFEAIPPVFSEGSGASGRRDKAAPEGTVVGLKRRTNSENLCIVIFL